VQNARGGITGRKIHFVVQDDQSSPQVAVQLTNGIIAKHVPVMLGSSLVANCNAMMAAVRESGPVQYCFRRAFIRIRRVTPATGQDAERKTKARSSSRKSISTRPTSASPRNYSASNRQIRKQQLLTAARGLGDVRYLSEGEVAAASTTLGQPLSQNRAWESWAARATARRAT
jgi:hypothetical protein